MSAIDTKRLCEKAAEYGMDLSAAAPQLAAYAQMLVEYNEKVNLTAITDAEGIEDRHFIDSLLLASQPEVQGSLVDVGTGAGFPGIVAKLYKPQLALTLMEPTGKRVDFLRYVCGQLGLEAEFVKERAEEAARKRWREAFDVASARAVAALPVLLEYCLPLVKKGGAVHCHEGRGQPRRRRSRHRPPRQSWAAGMPAGGILHCPTAVPAACCFMRKYRKLRRFTPETAAKLQKRR